MAKEDFCFTYYDGDAARDKAHMTRIERGAYDDIISAQRKRGHLSIDDIKRVLSKDFDLCWGGLEWILKKDAEEKYFIEWVDASVKKSLENSKRQKEKINEYWKKKKENDSTEIPQYNNGITNELPIKVKPLEDVYVNEEVNKSELINKSDEKYYLPEMQKTFKKHVKSYSTDQDRDFMPLQSIFQFIKNQKNKDGSLLQTQPHILAVWDTISAWIATDPFYAQKSLKTISNHIQEIYNKTKNGTNENKPTNKSGKYQPLGTGGY